jgi:predicted GNAT superfamily acetyltransferase
MNHSPDSTTFSIRALSAVEDFHHAEILQRDIWGMKDNTEIVPKDLMIVVQKSGGLALGAYNKANEMIGMLFGFPGRTTGNHYKHCSHMMGVLPSYRHTGVGEALKLRQRDFVLSQGVDLITWTVNPLEGVNASLNFGKLGVVCRQYYRNLYGEMADGLNHGLPSDRFEVEWWINSPRVEKRIHQKSTRRLSEMKQAGAQFVNRTVLAQGIRIPQEILLTTDALTLLFETPADFQAVKANSIKNALSWSEHTRAVFEACFQNGYIVSEFISEPGTNERRNFFVLQRDLTKILNA